MPKSKPQYHPPLLWLLLAALRPEAASRIHPVKLRSCPWYTERHTPRGYLAALSLKLIFNTIYVGRPRTSPVKLRPCPQETHFSTGTVLECARSAGPNPARTTQNRSHTHTHIAPYIHHPLPPSPAFSRGKAHIHHPLPPCEHLCPYYHVWPQLTYMPT